jgi:hypothetical protein
MALAEAYPESPPPRAPDDLNFDNDPPPPPLLQAAPEVPSPPQMVLLAARPVSPRVLDVAAQSYNPGNLEYNPGNLDYNPGNLEYSPRSSESPRVFKIQPNEYEV